MESTNEVMKSTLFSLEIAEILVLILAVLTVVLLVVCIMQIAKVNKLKKRLDAFTKGQNAASLEKEIIGLVEDNKFLKTSIDRNKKDIRVLYKKFESAFQKVGLVKYDAFKQMGGQLSYSLCLLDENNNGFIINSVHSTEGCYTYTKEVKNGVSNLDLGAEEAEALAIAMGNTEN